MSLRLASFMLVLISSLLLGHVSGAAAQAVESSSRVAPSLAARPMPANARLRLFGSAFGGAVLAGGASAAIGLGVYELTVCRPHGESDCDSDNTDLQGYVQGGAAFLGVAMISMPIASAAFTQMSGRRMGYAGRFRAALIGSAVGTGLGVVAGIATYFVADEQLRLGAPGAIVSASLVGLASIAAFSTLAYRLSDLRVARLSPALTPHAGGRGLSIGVSGRF